MQIFDNTAANEKFLDGVKKLLITSFYAGYTQASPSKDSKLTQSLAKEAAENYAAKVLEEL